MNATAEMLWRLQRVVPAGEIREQLDELYLRGGIPRGDLTGWRSLDELYTVGGGQWTLITGVPGMGKSELADALIVNLAERDDWTFSIWSPENFPVASHVAKLIEKRTRKPFNVGPTERVTLAEYSDALAWIEDRFTWISQREQAPLEILSTALSYGRKADKKHGIVIDPWNALDHHVPEWRPPGLSETEYVLATLSRITGVLRDPNNANVHLWMIAHPAKLYRVNGEYPIPTGYDISGSAHWFNKADNIIVIDRDKNADTQDVDVYVQKIRFKHVGHVGVATLKYDRVNGRYFEFDGPAIYDPIVGKPEQYVDPERAAIQSE